jgi:hypothetical protein
MYVHVQYVHVCIVNVTTTTGQGTIGAYVVRKTKTTATETTCALAMEIAAWKQYILSMELGIVHVYCRVIFCGGDVLFGDVLSW